MGNQKLALGFDTEDETITIFKGNIEENRDWFLKSNARYATSWGWYIIGSEKVPDILPEGVETMLLPWALVGDGTRLKPLKEVQEVINSFMFEASPSEFIGKVGDRIEFTAKLIIVTDASTKWGTNHFYVFKDEKENEYVWSTSSKLLEQNKTYIIRGTIKEHKTYKNSKQTVLTRCRAAEV